MSHAEPGMKLAMPIFHPDNLSTVLLRTGVVLERKAVDRLRDMKIPEVWIHYPKLEMISRFVSPGAMAARATMAGEVSEAFDAARGDAHARLDFPSYKAAMSGLVQKLACDQSSAIFIGELVDAGQPAVRHGANVGLISMLMGLRLGFYMMRERKRITTAMAKDVTSLGVAAMLHDIGMTRLEPEVLERWRRTQNEDDPEWRQHVRIGYDMVRGQIEPSAAACILHHHQRYDGSGFPMRRTLQGHTEPIIGDAIHIYSRIIAVADLYDRMINPASNPGDVSDEMVGIPPVAALQALVNGPHRHSVDPVVLRALLSVCPAYSPGSMVTLSNGVRAAVTDWSVLDPCRPTVHEIGDPRDDDLGDRIDLREDPTIEIVDCDGIDTSEYNFYPSSPQEFDLMHVEKAMMNGAIEPVPVGPGESGEFEVPRQVA